MNQKNAPFIIGIIFVLFFIILLQSPHIVRNPYNNTNTCDQATTTTDCSKISSYSSSQSPRSFGPQPVTYENKNSKPSLLYPNSFGPLTNVYKDKEFEFSLKYPDELRISIPDCVSLNDKESDGTFGIKICNQNSPLSFYNPNFSSLNEYKNNYILKTKKETEALRVYIQKNEDITTSQGVKGLKQIIDVEVFDPITGTSTTKMRDAFWLNQTRYVFYKPQKGMMELLIFNGTLDLKDAIIQSISF